jgi:hypothetical protein
MDPNASSRQGQHQKNLGKQQQQPIQPFAQQLQQHQQNIQQRNLTQQQMQSGSQFAQQPRSNQNDSQAQPVPYQTFTSQQFQQRPSTGFSDQTFEQPIASPFGFAPASQACGYGDMQRSPQPYPLVYMQQPQYPQQTGSQQYIPFNQQQVEQNPQKTQKYVAVP